MTGDSQPLTRIIPTLLGEPTYTSCAG